MKINPSEKLSAQKNGHGTEPPDESASVEHKAVDSVPVAGGLDAALETIQSSIDQQLQNATGLITQRVMDEVSKSLRQAKPSVIVGPERRLADPTGGFTSLGDFAQAVRRLAIHETPDPRLAGMVRKAFRSG